MQNRPAGNPPVDAPVQTQETPPPEEKPPATEEEPTETVPKAKPSVNPDQTSSIDIEPMGITVYYVRGIPGFEFVVEKTANGTEYVQFSSPDLRGTKCTDDEGAFASIILNPSATEAQTLTSTTTVGDNTYGLSLADATCTSDQALLQQYQDSFTRAFSLLSSMEN